MQARDCAGGRSSCHALKSASRRQYGHKPARAAVLEAPTQSSDADLQLLADAAQVKSAARSGQGEYGRGLMIHKAVKPLQPVCSIPWRNCLVISDDPVTDLRTFGARRTAVSEYAMWFRATQSTAVWLCTCSHIMMLLPWCAPMLSSACGHMRANARHISNGKRMARRRCTD